VFGFDFRGTGGLLASRIRGWISSVLRSSALPDGLIKARDCLRDLVLIGEPSLPRAVSEFVVHYHRERRHQGLVKPTTEGEIRCRSRLATSSTTTIVEPCKTA